MNPPRGKEENFNGVRFDFQRVVRGLVIDRSGVARLNPWLMDAIVDKLRARLDRWEPEISREVRALVAEIIELADSNALDLIRSRAVEQEVLDLLASYRPPFTHIPPSEI